MNCVPFPDDTYTCTLISGWNVCANPEAVQLRVVKSQLRRRGHRRP